MNPRLTSVCCRMCASQGRRARMYLIGPPLAGALVCAWCDLA